MTNREWLNSLSDEEFAVEVYNGLMDNNVIDYDGDFFEDNFIDWLKAEREEER